jgi:hypothetical protein
MLPGHPTCPPIYDHRCGPIVPPECNPPQSYAAPAPFVGWSPRRVAKGEETKDADRKAHER